MPSKTLFCGSILLPSITFGGVHCSFILELNFHESFRIFWPMARCVLDFFYGWGASHVSQTSDLRVADIWGAVQCGLVLTFFAALASQMGLRQVWADNVGEPLSNFSRIWSQRNLYAQKSPQKCQKESIYGPLCCNVGGCLPTCQITAALSRATRARQ